MEYSEYRKKLKGCYLGKTVGGTLGMPYEGHLDTRDVSYYDPVPTEMVPNDDVDNQVIDLEILMKYGLPLNRFHLGQVWAIHGTGYPDEYGVAAHNTEMGLAPALTGIYNNEVYKAGMGAAIRSELFASLAPGEPELAARLAAEDACTDHTEEGVFAAMFLAALESAAYVCRDVHRLIAIGLSVIPEGNRFSDAVRDMVANYREGCDLLALREAFLKRFPSPNWTDVSINVPLVVLALLASGGDFARSICLAADFGYDADCTCATVGAITGILDPDGIEQRWLEPIGEKLVLSKDILAMHEPETIGQFCDLIAGAAQDVLAYYGAGTRLEGDLPESPLPTPWLPAGTPLADPGLTQAMIAASPVPMFLAYPDGVSLVPGEAGAFTLTLCPAKPFAGTLTLRAPFGWTVVPASVPVDTAKNCKVNFTVTAPKALSRRPGRNELLLSLTRDGETVTAVAGLPLSTPWLVQRPGGAWEEVEQRGAFLRIPAGPCALRVKPKIPVAPEVVRIRVASENRKARLFMNGKEMEVPEVRGFVPRFHGPGAIVKEFTSAERASLFEIRLEDGEECLFFFGLGRRASCGQWIPGVEYLTPDKD